MDFEATIKEVMEYIVSQNEGAELVMIDKRFATCKWFEPSKRWPNNKKKVELQIESLEARKLMTNHKMPTMLMYLIEERDEFNKIVCDMTGQFHTKEDLSNQVKEYIDCIRN